MPMAVGLGADERLWRGVSGKERHSAPLGRCVQCNGLAADAPLVTGEGYPPTGVHLHEQCRAFWLRDHKVTRERFRRVDAHAAPGTHCAQYHRSDGEVGLWRDSHIVGCKSEPLHEDCCGKFWR
jgi:hypothetical protein